MRLFEAILDANHRALSGDATAGLHPADFAEELPVAALTCIDPRLNPLFPSVLGLPEDQFIWLRNAGNIITGPLSSSTRSLAMACVVKGAKEIAIIGHTDCAVAKTSAMQLIDRFRQLGIERHLLPDNINEYFGLFSSERQNIIKATEIVRHSPLISSKAPVHGLLVDIVTGKLDWLVNGYEALESFSGRLQHAAQSAAQTVDMFRSLADFKIGEMKFPETRIGEIVSKAENWASEKVQQIEKLTEEKAHEDKAGAPPKLPLPPPIRPRIHLRRR